jgi:REP element-mobilizing transposase RayT
MPRPHRCDEPGTWHHIFNRATARRALFLSEKDYRYFLDRVAGAVESGDIRVHNFVLMINHFHMLAESPRGRMGAAMHDIQRRYARHINRRLGRDGSIFRARYGNRPVTTDTYRRTLVSYIDSNPVASGVVARPEDFPWSSAQLYAAAERPPWLTTDWIDSEVRARAGADARDTSAYRETFPVRCDPSFLAWVERRLRYRYAARDDLDVVLGPDPEMTRAWMRRQAQLADGEELVLPVADSAAILRAIRAATPRITKLAWRRRPGRGAAVSAGDQLRAGLLRDAGRLTWSEIARLAEMTPSTSRNAWLAHRRSVLEDALYADEATSIVRVAAGATAGTGSLTAICPVGVVRCGVRA